MPRNLCCVVLLAAALILPTHAGYLVSVSSAEPAEPLLTVLDDRLQPVGSVTVSGPVKHILLADDGRRLIVVSGNAAAPLTVIDISSNGLGQPRTVTLPSGTPTHAALSPDGSRLVVATSGPSHLHFVQMSNEQVLPPGLPLPASAEDLEFTRDGAHLLVLTSTNILQPVRTADWQLLAPVALPGSFPASSLRLSIAPFGSVFITGPNVLLELSETPPFAELARTSLASSTLTHPDKLHFTPSGNRAYVTGRMTSGPAIGLIDFTLRGPSAPAGTMIATALPLNSSGPPSSGYASLLDPLFVVQESRAIALGPTDGQVFDVLPGAATILSVQNVSINGQPLVDVHSIAVSDEFPNALRFYYVKNAGRHYMLPLLGLGTLNDRELPVGKLRFVTSPSGDSPASIVAYGGGRTVQTESKLRYYVRVLDDASKPVKGSTVTFRITAGTPVLANASATTDRQGFACVELTAPSVAGDFTIEASAAAAAPIAIRSTAVPQTGGSGGEPPATAQLIKVGGDGQLARFGTPNAELVVKAVDASGNPIEGKQIIWQSPNPSVQWLSPQSVQTDQNGEARVRFVVTGFLDPTEPFAQVQIEALADIGTVVFYATQYPVDLFGQPQVTLEVPTPLQPTIRLKLGTPASGKLRFKVVSGFGLARPNNVPIANVSLRVESANTNPAEGPVVTCAEKTTPLSNVEGNVTCTLLAKGRTGNTVITAVVGNEYRFENIMVVVEPGDPVPPVKVSGDNQSGRAGSDLPQPLVARIVDAGGNPLAGRSVSWLVSNASALQLINPVLSSGPDGLVSTGVRLGSIPGRHTVTVRFGQLEAVFTVTVESSVTTLRKVSGDGQPVVLTNTAFPQPLVVEVLDQSNQPVQGIAVAWSVTGPATLSAASTTTGANGRAQVNVTAGAQAGTITVTATVGTLMPVSFSLQSRLPGPGITAQSFRNYATGKSGVSPGNLVLLSGADIAKNVSQQAVANLLLGRLPTELKGLTVEFRSGGQSYYAPIYWIVKDQAVEEALIQVPYEITGASVDVNVSIDGASTLVTGVPVSALSPGIIEDQIDGRRAAIVIRSDGLVATKATPARRGETVRLYAIGLGQTNPPAETNRVGRPDQTVLATVAVGIDNAGVEVVEAKLAENLIGIYEVFFKIPEDAQLGDRPLGLLAAPAGGQAYYAQGSVIPIGPKE